MKVILLVLSVLILASISIFFCLNIPRKLNKDIKKQIEKYGLYHVTDKKTIEYMVGVDDYYYFKSTSRLMSFTNLFRKSVFFFLDKPTKNSYRYNISGTKETKKMLKISPQNIDDFILTNLRWRTFDKTIIHIGDITIKSDVTDLEFKE